MKAELKNKVLKIKDGVFWTSKIKVLSEKEEENIYTRLIRENQSINIYFSKCWNFPRDGSITDVQTNFGGIVLRKFHNGDYLSLFFLWLYQPKRYDYVCDILKSYNFEKNR